jgi:hypothetical protein
MTTLTDAEVRLAAALNRVRPVGLQPPIDSQFQHVTDCRAVSDALAELNPSFDPLAFLARSGVDVSNLYDPHRPTAPPLYIRLRADCAKEDADELRSHIREMIDAAAKHADDALVFAPGERDYDEDDGGWLDDFCSSLEMEAENAPAEIADWFRSRLSA